MFRFFSSQNNWIFDRRTDLKRRTIALWIPIQSPNNQTTIARWGKQQEKLLVNRSTYRSRLFDANNFTSAYPARRQRESPNENEIHVVARTLTCTQAQFMLFLRQIIYIIVLMSALLERWTAKRDKTNWSERFTAQPTMKLNPKLSGE